MGGGAQGGGQPPQDAGTPILIEKTSPETVFGPESEAHTIIDMHPPALEPTAHAESDTSSILMSDTSGAPAINIV
jgi:hypothetical protein